MNLARESTSRPAHQLLLLAAQAGCWCMCTMDVWIIWTAGLLLRAWISRGRHLDHRAQAGALDCLLHQPRGLGLFDELADIGETSGVPLRDQRRYADDPEAVLQHPRAGQLR